MPESLHNSTSTAPVTVAPMPCLVCNAQMARGPRSFLFECGTCGFLCSTLTARIGKKRAHAAIDEDRRAQALGALRAQNFEIILDRLATCQDGAPGALLDVGCAHGWFLEAAARRGYEAVGIEPDPAMHEVATGRGLKVWRGFFPADVADDLRFDVIIFNDVLEHLPQPDAVIRSCAERLTPRGCLVINIPNSRGAFYRIASLLEGMGIGGPFERMWQMHFVSPHLSYFTPDQLERVAGRFGLTEVHRSTLPSINLADLWARLRYDRESSALIAGVTFAGVVVLAPFLHLLPADISLQIFTRAKCSWPDANARCFDSA